MRIINNELELEKYFYSNFIENNKAILIDEFLLGAKEIDVDTLSDGNDVFIAGILEHIEEAGVHSGDSACSLPPQTIPKKIIHEIENITKSIVKKLKLLALQTFNMQLKTKKFLF